MFEQCFYLPNSYFTVFYFPGYQLLLRNWFNIMESTGCCVSFNTVLVN